MNEKSEYVFRRAEAGDVHAAVPMMYSAGVELYDYCFQTNKAKATDYIKHEFSSGIGMMGYLNHTVAVLNDEVVGIGAFYSGHDIARLSIGTAKNIFSFYSIFSALAVIWRAKDTASVVMRPTRNVLYVANFGVRPDMRSRGVGAALLKHKCEFAKQNGFSTYALDVAMTNPRAQALYERFGFKVTKEKYFSGRRRGHNVPDQRQMEISIA